jgi:hypothetical protein
MMNMCFLLGIWIYFDLVVPVGLNEVVSDDELMVIKRIHSYLNDVSLLEENQRRKKSIMNNKFVYFKHIYLRKNI